MSTAERLKLKKMQKLKEAETMKDQDASMEVASSSKPQEPMSDVEKVTEVANAILTASGNMEIYQETFESIKFKVGKQF